MFNFVGHAEGLLYRISVREADSDIDKIQRGGKVMADFTNPERELFMWAVLFNRRELAELFWKAGKDHIGQ